MTTANIPLNVRDIQRYLPHRYPFLLVDTIDAIDIVAGSMTATKNVTINEPFFTGHFPRFPIMPGVLIVEALAQASGVLTFQMLGRLPEESELFYLAGIDNTRFKRMVIPGDVLRLEIELLKKRQDQLWKFRGTASVKGEVACVTEFMHVRADPAAISGEPLSR